MLLAPSCHSQLYPAADHVADSGPETQPISEQRKAQMGELLASDEMGNHSEGGGETLEDALQAAIHHAGLLIDHHCMLSVDGAFAVRDAGGSRRRV